MHSIKITLLFIFFLSLSYSQDKITWAFSYNKDAKNVEFKAILAEGWHLYSQELHNQIGPIPTTFTFKTNDNIKLIGKTVEPTPIKEYDENFESTLNFFKNEVVFLQKIDFKSPELLEGKIEYMVCNDRMCLPPTEKEFKIELVK